MVLFCIMGWEILKLSYVGSVRKKRGLVKALVRDTPTLEMFYPAESFIDDPFFFFLKKKKLLVDFSFC